MVGSISALVCFCKPPKRGSPEISGNPSSAPSPSDPSSPSPSTDERLELSTLEKQMVAMTVSKRIKKNENRNKKINFLNLTK